MTTAKKNNDPFPFEIEITEVDCEALERALQTVLTKPESPQRLEQIEAMLADKSRPRQETAEFCSYHLQVRNLGLRPWDNPPMHSNGVGRSPEAKLHKRLKRAGLSIFEPDPLKALREFEPSKERNR